ncbi:hypothetical protein L8P21_09400, partial [Enterobacter kobei]
MQSALPDGGFALSVLRENFKERNKTQSKKPRTLRYGVLLFDAWQFPTLTWGDPTLPSALRRFTSEFGMG